MRGTHKNQEKMRCYSYSRITKNVPLGSSEDAPWYVKGEDNYAKKKKTPQIKSPLSWSPVVLFNLQRCLFFDLLFIYFFESLWKIKPDLLWGSCDWPETRELDAWPCFSRAAVSLCRPRAQILAPDPAEIRLLRGHKLSVTCLVITPDETHIFSASKDCSIIKCNYHPWASERFLCLKVASRWVITALAPPSCCPGVVRVTRPLGLSSFQCDFNVLNLIPSIQAVKWGSSSHWPALKWWFLS